MSKFDAVFYDFDGTLADSIPIILKSFRMAYEDVFGYCDRTPEDFMTFIGRPLETTFEQHGPELTKTLTDAYLRINEKMLRNDEIDLFPGVEEDLRYIKSLGIKQGIVTSKKMVSCMTTVKIKGIEDIFDTFIFKEDSDKHKPDGRPLEVAAERAGLSSASRILYVGDAVPDMLCARNAGAGFALVDWTRMPFETLPSGDGTWIISSLKDIPCIINS
ncbi:MAG: HAD family hydrolase [Clostridiales bacterium]|nr:HAD family hydrolase [Clostridiales bacterium]